MRRTKKEEISSETGGWALDDGSGLSEQTTTRLLGFKEGDCTEGGGE